jgi:hypothetical protein
MDTPEFALQLSSAIRYTRKIDQSGECPFVQILPNEWEKKTDYNPFEVNE